MKRLFSISVLGVLAAVLALSVSGAMSSEEDYEENDFHVQDIGEDGGGDEEASAEEEEPGETEPELEIAPSPNLYEESEPYAEGLEEDDSEDEASEEEVDAEEELELVVTPPKRTIKNERDEYLKSSGLEFKPYFPDDVYPITPSGESAYRRLPAAEPIVLVPDEEGEPAETDEEKQEEEGEVNDDEGSAEIDEETQEEEGEDEDNDQ